MSINLQPLKIEITNNCFLHLQLAKKERLQDPLPDSIFGTFDFLNYENLDFRNVVRNSSARRLQDF